MGCLQLFDFMNRLSWLSGLCFAAGFVLIIVEMFFPGFGVSGILGTILLFIGILSISKTWIDALIIILIIIALASIVLFILYRSGIRGKLSKTVVLKDSLDKKSGFSGTEDLSKYNGAVGVSTSTLRPSGTAEFEGTKLDVVAQGEFIEKGRKIRVIKVEGSRVVVVETE